MGRGRGGTAGIAVGGFDVAVGARRGRDERTVAPLLQRELTPEGRAAVAGAVVAAVTGDYKPAIDMLQDNRSRLDDSAALRLLHTETARALAEHGSRKSAPAQRLLLALAGAGPSQNMHIVRADNELHILPDSVLAAREHYGYHATAACGRTVAGAGGTFAGDWAAAPQTYEPSSRLWFDPEGEEHAHPGPAVRCAGCAEHADFYEECTVEDDTAERFGPGDVAAMRERLTAQTAAILDTVVNDELEGPLSNHLLEEQALKASCRATEAQLGQWMSERPDRLRSFLGEAHMRFYAGRIAGHQGVSREQAEDMMCGLARTAFEETMSEDVGRDGVDGYAYGRAEGEFKRLRDRVRDKMAALGGLKFG